MAVVDTETSVRDELMTLHPLILVALKHGPGIEEKAARAILEKVEEGACHLIHREPRLSHDSITISMHTRLRELMSDAQMVRGGAREPETTAKEEGPQEAEETGRAEPCVGEELRQEMETVLQARIQAVQSVLAGADGVTTSLARLYVGEGLSDREIAKRLSISSEDVERIRSDLLTRLEDAWLGADPTIGSLDDVPPCFDPMWFYHFVPYVRRKLDPDRTNYIEGHAFRCLRCGARLGGLQIIMDRIRSPEKPPETVTGYISKPKAQRGTGLKSLAGVAAAIIVGIFTALLVRSSIGRDGVQATTSEISVLQPVQIPAELALPDESPLSATLSETLEAYERRDYSKASSGWERLYDEGAKIPDLTLYLGVSQLLAGHAERAAVILAREVPPDSGGIPYHFYRAQSLLVLGRVEEGREELRRVLAMGESPYREQAETQLTALLSPPGAE